jgi:nitrite reductase/ring-hydroxylating ferredoxin subunit
LDIVPPGSLKQFRISEKEILVINSNSQIFCLEARCTHAGAPLAEGKLEDSILTCPWHGSRFNVTNGDVVKGPAKTGLQVYKSMVKDNFLFVEI